MSYYLSPALPAIGQNMDGTAKHNAREAGFLSGVKNKAAFAEAFFLGRQAAQHGFQIGCRYSREQAAFSQNRINFFHYFSVLLKIQRFFFNTSVSFSL